ncbi:RHS repeat-associated core domain-containing protein, partial [Niastella koreensis]
YDPQIGRFVQLDPLTDDYPFLTPYQYASCDPITNIDIDGLEGGVSTLAKISSTVSDFSYSYNIVSDVKAIFPAISAAESAGTSFKLFSTLISSTGIFTSLAHTAVNLIDNSGDPKQVGKGGGGGVKPKPAAPAAKPKPAAKPEQKVILRNYDDDDSFFSNMWEKQKRGWWLAWKRTKEAGQQMWENAQNNWRAHRDPVHQFAANPMMYLSPVGPEGAAIEEVAALNTIEKEVETGTKLLNQFNSAESLIEGAGELTPVKGAMQGFVKGDGNAIFKAISQGGARQANGTVIMQDGTTLFNHFSTTTGVYTIDINKAGQIFKIRITP